MFTGLVEETGMIREITELNGGRKFTVQAADVLSDLKVNDSIAINGCCQTVIEVTTQSFSCISIEETLKKTTFGLFRKGDRVNLERPLLPSTRLGGHFVMGHVDCVGVVVRKKVLGTSWEFDIEFPEEFEKYIIRIGSISVDGTSLTVADLKKNRFTVAIIPHTMDKTVFSSYDEGKKVNLEFDMLGKYMEKLVTGKD
ncbi:MAG: riboflavin synthase [Bacteroidetes bacterium]|nr:riboflavin synthase [Bacteroidota bacterium]